MFVSFRTVCPFTVSTKELDDLRREVRELEDSLSTKPLELLDDEDDEAERS